MKNLGLVSVFMPTYNAEKFIIEAVESVIQQNYSNIELVISDDASKDETPTILNDLKDKYPNIIKLFLQQKNLGITENCNFLLNQCLGDFICFTAGDDVLMYNCISKSLCEFNNNKSLAIIFHKNIQIDESSQIIKIKSKAMPSHIGTIVDFLKKGVYVQTNGMLVKSSKIPITGYNNNLAFASDFDFLYKILSVGNFLYINEELSMYRKHNSSVTALNPLECFSDSMRRLFDILLRHPNYSSCLISQISNSFRGSRKILNGTQYENMMKASIGIKPWNIKSLIIYSAIN